MDFKAFMREAGFFTEAFDRHVPIKWLAKEENLWLGEFSVPTDDDTGAIRYQVRVEIKFAKQSWLEQNTDAQSYDSGGPDGTGHHLLKLSFQRWSDKVRPSPAATPGSFTHERPLDNEPQPQMAYVFATVLQGFREAMEGNPHATAAYFTSYGDTMGNSKASANSRFSAYQRLASRFAPLLGFVRVPAKFPRDFLFVKKEYATYRPLPKAEPTGVLPKLGSLVRPMFDKDKQPQPQPA